MQQFARVQQGNVIIPILVNGDRLMDLRPLIQDITPEVITGGLLTNVNATGFQPLTGEVSYLAPIKGVRRSQRPGLIIRSILRK